MKNEYAEHVLVMLAQIEAKVKDSFTMISIDQLNWTIDEKTWSIAECIDHMYITNLLYVDVFKKILKNENKHNFWTKLPFWYKVGGRILLKSVDPENEKKVKTSKSLSPRLKKYDLDILCKFEDSQRALIQLIKELDQFDHNKIRISSPINKIIVYSLKDACNVLWKHQLRHTQQAKSLTELPKFPAE